MENEKVVVLQLKLSRQHCLFALAFAFLCFHPRPLGSETLTLNTFYPAPYGGYVALLTTGGTAASPVNTLLARDAGRVGIGTTTPLARLHVTGAGVAGGLDRIVRFDRITAGGGADTFVMGYDDVASVWRLRSGGVNSPPIAFNMGNFERMRIANSGAVGIGVVPDAADGLGDLRIGGTIRDICTSVAYGVGTTVNCPASHRVVGFTGDGVPRVMGFLPSATGTTAAGTYVVLGEDWSGTMVCCKLPG